MIIKKCLGKNDTIWKKMKSFVLGNHCKIRKFSNNEILNIFIKSLKILNHLNFSKKKYFKARKMLKILKKREKMT